MKLYGHSLCWECRGKKSVESEVLPGWLVQCGTCGGNGYTLVSVEVPDPVYVDKSERDRRKYPGLRQQPPEREDIVWG
jgi:hypothetical protein